MKAISMRTLRKNWLLTGSLILMLNVLQACGRSDSKNDEGAGEHNEAAPVQVSIRIVSSEPFTEVLSLTGYVKSLEDVIVSTEEGGVLKRWEVRRGAFVRKGETIASMKDDVLKPQYEAALAQYEIAELTYQKQKKVFEDQGISEVQAKTAEYNRDAARAQMELARNRLERASIRSPIDGILDDRFIDEGELSPPGAPIGRVVNLERTKVLVNVPENQVGLVHKNSVATIGVSAFPGETFTGAVSFVGSAVVTDNRTVPVEILVPNPGKRLKPDMIARVRLEATGGRNAIVVPEGAVTQVDQRTSVVYVEVGGIVEKRTVTTGGRGRGGVEIVEGLQAGDHLIVSAIQNIFDGQSVEVSADTTAGDAQ